jgi:hypothetical protein
MKIFEITSKNNEKIDNIMSVLSLTNDEKNFYFVEKYLNSLVAKENVMSKEARLKAIYSALQQQADDSLVDFIEAKLKQKEINARVDKAWTTRNWDSGRMKKYKELFKVLMVQSGGTLRSKIELLYYITKNSNAIPGSLFKSTFSATIDEIVPDRIGRNSAFQNIKNSIFFDDSFRGKGIGPGEFALSLLGEAGDIIDDGGDITIGGVGIELKDGGGGSIKTGSPSSFRRADDLRSWLGQQVGIALDRNNKLYLDKPSEFSEAFMRLDPTKRNSISLEYIQGLYPNLDATDQQDIAHGMANNIGTSVVATYFGKAILNSYKKQDEWDTILFIAKNGKMVNLASIDDANMINFKLAGINRDGDTQALPDGYINGSIFRSVDPATGKPVRKSKSTSTKTTIQKQPVIDPNRDKIVAMQNSADDTFVNYLKDPMNPLSVAWKAIKPQHKADAKDYILDLIVDGRTDQEIAADLNNDLFESIDLDNEYISQSQATKYLRDMGATTILSRSEDLDFYLNRKKMSVPMYWNKTGYRFVKTSDLKIFD